MLAMNSWVMVIWLDDNDRGTEQPATQLLVYRVMSPAEYSLGHLRDQGLRVAQQ